MGDDERRRINAIIAQRFDRHRPVALSMTYNGAGVCGAVLALSFFYFAVTLERIGQVIDGAGEGTSPTLVQRAAPRDLPGARLMRHPAFLTLACGMTFGMFSQIGLVSHLFSLLVPSRGVPAVGGRDRNRRADGDGVGDVTRLGLSHVHGGELSGAGSRQHALRRLRRQCGGAHDRCRRCSRKTSLRTETSYEWSRC